MTVTFFPPLYFSYLHFFPGSFMMRKKKEDGQVEKSLTHFSRNLWLASVKQLEGLWCSLFWEEIPMKHNHHQRHNFWFCKNHVTSSIIFFHNLKEESFLSFQKVQKARNPYNNHNKGKGQWKHWKNYSRRDWLNTTAAGKRCRAR